MKQLSALSGLSEDPSVVGLLRVEHQVPISTTTVHQWQYGTNQYSLIPIHKLIYQGVICKTYSPPNSPYSQSKSLMEKWKLTVGLSQPK